MTNVVAVLEPGLQADVLIAQFDFHVAAGAGAVLVGTGGDDDATRDLIASRGDDPRFHAVTAGNGWARTALGRSAVVDHGADWVIELRPGDFWWPRGESLRDVLDPVPPRYGVVQGLVRSFAPPLAGETPLWERATVRDSLLVHAPRDVEPGLLLRPAYRAHPGLDVDVPGGGPDTRQPLRAWYPIEVLRLPVDHGTRSEEWIADRLADGRLVVDERLRDALAALSVGESPLFTVPDVVDDASYAGECAAVGEVDLESLDRQIRELEQRIAWLEGRPLARVRRVASRALRRPRR